MRWTLAVGWVGWVRCGGRGPGLQGKHSLACGARNGWPELRRILCTQGERHRLL